MYRRRLKHLLFVTLEDVFMKMFKQDLIHIYEVKNGWPVFRIVVTLDNLQNKKLTFI